MDLSTLQFYSVYTTMYPEIYRIYFVTCMEDYLSHVTLQLREDSPKNLIVPVYCSLFIYTYIYIYINSNIMFITKSHFL